MEKGDGVWWLFLVCAVVWVVVFAYDGIRERMNEPEGAAWATHNEEGNY